jgi:hypothetical protein
MARKKKGKSDKKKAPQPPVEVDEALEETKTDSGSVEDTTDLRIYTLVLSETQDEDLIDYLDQVDDPSSAIHSLVNLGRVVQVAGSFSTSGSVLEGLFSKLDQRLDSFNQTMEAFQGKSKSSAAIGAMGENISLHHFESQFTTYGDSFEIESSTGQNMDIEAKMQIDVPTGPPQQEDIRLEIKEYKKDIDANQVSKFWRDLRQRPSKYAMFVSMKSKISGKDNIAIEVQDGKLAIFVSNENHDQKRHLIAWELLRHIVKADFVSNTAPAGVSPNVRTLISNISSQMDIISETKSYIGSLLETSTKLQANTIDRVSEIMQIHARSIALLDQYQRNIRDLLKGTSEEYKQMVHEYEEWKDNHYLPLLENFSQENQTLLTYFEAVFKELHEQSTVNVDEEKKFVTFKSNDSDAELLKIDNQGKKIKITIYGEVADNDIPESFVRKTPTQTIIELANATTKIAELPISKVREALKTHFTLDSMPSDEDVNGAETSDEAESDTESVPESNADFEK